jgi:pimeloyl-ACP methyl ester carboxylesterase
MGGAIALHYALKWQGDLGSIILVSTGAKLGVSPRILEGLRTDYGETVKQVLSPWNFGSVADANLKQWVEQEILKVSQNVALADYLACNSFDVRSKLTDVKLPSLIIVGDQDKLTPLMWSTFMHERIRYSTLKIISGAGHLAMLENPAEFNETTYRFSKKPSKGHRIS